MPSISENTHSDATELAASLAQMQSLADTLEGMRRHALETEGSAFAAASGGFVAVLRERIAEARAYVHKMDTQTMDVKALPDADDPAPMTTLQIP